MSATADTVAPEARVAAIVPVLNEAEAIGDVVRGLLAHGAGQVIVVDGKSTDGTAVVAESAGARVVVEPRRGYGRAMMSGLDALPATATVVLFFDGDGSDRTDLVPTVIGPVLDGRADFVHGTRLKGNRERGSLGAVQVTAGRLAGWLIRLRYGVRFTDMSPFRAISRTALERLDMSETSFGWNLEMQMRVAAAGMRVLEVPVGQRRRRGGVSKVSGDLGAAVRAAYVITRTFLRLAGQMRQGTAPSAQAPGNGSQPTEHARLP